MAEEKYFLVHDVGTTGNKSCLYRLGQQLELVGSELEEYPLYVLPNGGVEQQPDEWLYLELVEIRGLPLLDKSPQRSN